MNAIILILTGIMIPTFIAISISLFYKKEKKIGIIFASMSVFLIILLYGKIKLIQDNINGPSAVNKTMSFYTTYDINGTDTIKTYSDTTYVIK